MSAAEARRVALAAQGFARPAPTGRIDARSLRTRVIDHVGLIQIDSVNVLERAHYLPAFSRIGPYDVDVLDRLSSYSPRRLFEYWGHEASLVPVELQPSLRWRMVRVEQDGWGSMKRAADKRPELVQALLDDLRERGPLSARDLAHHDDPRERKGPWWDWSDVKAALEFLFFTGAITSARRRRFERLYDVPERVLPASVIATPTPAPEDGQRELIRVAARSLGVATEPDLRDYFRLPAADGKLRVAELVEAGELLPVEVEGWGAPAYLDPGARFPRAVDAAALIGPFDPLIWFRPRAERVFGFRYRIEIYVPKPKRVHGYYVLPFLLGDRLVARVDLKSDRAAGTLLVQAAHAEPDAPPETAAALREQLASMASWLGLERVKVVKRGDLAGALSAQRDRDGLRARRVPGGAGLDQHGDLGRLLALEQLLTGLAQLDRDHDVALLLTLLDDVADDLRLRLRLGDRAGGAGGVDQRHVVDGSVERVLDTRRHALLGREAELDRLGRGRSDERRAGRDRRLQRLVVRGRLRRDDRRVRRAAWSCPCSSTACSCRGWRVPGLVPLVPVCRGAPRGTAGTSRSGRTRSASP